jgi:hypothetical protein
VASATRETPHGAAESHGLPLRARSERLGKSKLRRTERTSEPPGAVSDA